MPGLAPPTTGNPVPLVDLAASGDAEGGPGATGGGAGNSDHDVPKEPPTPSSRPTLNPRHKRRTKPNSKYDNFILNTKLPLRDLTREVADRVTIPDESRGLSRASSVTGSVSTTISQTQMQASIVFDSTDASLRVLAERVRNFNRSSTSTECASLREDLQGARRSIIPYDENKLTPELQEQRRGWQTS